MIDVRAPVEVAAGALPGAHPLPLMLDHERAAVGLRYKEAGQAAAIELGFRLAGPHLPERAAAWRAVAAEGPSALCCWRGGLRSAIAAEQLGDPQVPTVRGGYKAIRAHLLAAFELELRERPIWVLGGLTGSGKTELLHALQAAPELQSVDLEGLAGHRGSAFGALDAPQPAQATFENALAATVVLHPQSVPVLFEDESQRIGQRLLPAALWEAMRGAPMLWLEAPLEERVARVAREYVQEPLALHGAKAVEANLRGALQRIERRLGGVRARELLALQSEAFREGAEPAAHRLWIEPLLLEYYDRLYLHAFERSGRSVVRRGDAGELRAALRST